MVKRQMSAYPGEICSLGYMPEKEQGTIYKLRVPDIALSEYDPAASDAQG